MACHRGCTWAELVRADSKCSGGSGVTDAYVPAAHKGHGHQVYTSPAAASIWRRCSEYHSLYQPAAKEAAWDDARAASAAGFGVFADGSPRFVSEDGTHRYVREGDVLLHTADAPLHRARMARGRDGARLTPEYEPGYVPDYSPLGWGEDEAGAGEAWGGDHALYRHAGAAADHLAYLPGG